MPKILITGANGLLGQHLVSLLTENTDWKILATARGENRLRDKAGYSYKSMDITDKQAVANVFEEEKPDFVIHGAAMTQVDHCETQQKACWEANVLATQNLLEAAGRQGSFFIFISTDFIFDGQEGPYKEEAIPNPVNYYGMSKLAAEMLLVGSSTDSAILRTVLVFGVPEDDSRSNIVLWIKNSLEAGKQIKVVDDQWRTPTLVEDLAKGCQLVIEKKLEGTKLAPVYNISGKELLTPYQMALKIAHFFQLDASLITRADATTFSQTARRPVRTGFILDKAEKDLQYIPYSFEEALAIVKKEL